MPPGLADEGQPQAPPLLPGAVDNLECAICLSLLCRPLRLSCSHSFCKECLVGALGSGSASTSSHRACPLCRAEVPAGFNPSAASVHGPLEAYLQHQCTVEYGQRLLEQAACKARTAQLRIGNSHEVNLAGGLRFLHRWTVQVAVEQDAEQETPLRGWSASDLIDSVVFALVPSCRVVDHATGMTSPPTKGTVVARSAPFEVTGISWGLFTVQIVVAWKSWLGLPALHLAHELTSEAHPAASWTYGVDLGDAAPQKAEGLRRSYPTTEAEGTAAAAAAPPSTPASSAAGGHHEEESSRPAAVRERTPRVVARDPRHLDPGLEALGLAEGPGASPTRAVEAPSPPRGGDRRPSSPRRPGEATRLRHGGLGAEPQHAGEAEFGVATRGGGPKPRRSKLSFGPLNWLLRACTACRPERT